MVKTCLPMQVDIRDMDSIPGRKILEIVANPPQYSCLGDPQTEWSLATAHGIAKRT